MKLNWKQISTLPGHDPLRAVYTSGDIALSCDPSFKNICIKVTFLLELTTSKAELWIIQITTTNFENAMKKDKKILVNGKVYPFSFESHETEKDFRDKLINLFNQIEEDYFNIEEENK